MHVPTRILIVDDDQVSRQLLAEVLAQSGYVTALAESGEQALELIRKEKFPLVLSDIRMHELSGFDLLREVKRIQPQTTLVLMTGFGSMEGALEAIREGAFDYISKPFRMDDLRALVVRALKHAQSLSQAADKEPSPRFRSQTLIGKSPAIIEVYKTLARAALSTSNVLITGEPGTGKALVARAIHDHGPRKDAPFLKRGQEESEPIEIAFTQARGGTLLLEEIDQFSPTLQTRLMRAVEAAEAEGTSPRIVATSRRARSELELESVLRRDLFFKLNVISIDLPPLRSRMEDLQELVDFFVGKHAERNGKRVSHLSPPAMELLRSHAWPGNVRELEHAIERAVALTGAAVLEPEDFRELKRSAATPLAMAVIHGSGSLDEMEKVHILRVLEESGYNKSRASEVLGIDRATLYRKAKLYGIDLKGGRA